MKEIQLEKLKDQIPEQGFKQLYAEDQYLRTSHKAHEAQALWNFTVAMMDAEADDFETIYKVAAESHDLTHICGFHQLKWRQSRWMAMRWFWTLVWHNKQLLELKPRLKGYIEHVCEGSRVRWGRATHPMGLLDDLPLRQSEGHLPWRTPDWVAARRPPRIVVPKMTEFWPFITGQPAEEHKVLLAVDAVISRTLPREIRADVCQDLVVAILMGDVKIENLMDIAPQFIRSAYKQYPKMFGPKSLDTPLGPDSKGVLADIVPGPSPTPEKVLLEKESIAKTMDRAIQSGFSREYVEFVAHEHVDF